MLNHEKNLPPTRSAAAGCLWDRLSAVWQQFAGIGLETVGGTRLQLPFLSVGGLLFAAAIAVAATVRQTPPLQPAEIAVVNLRGANIVRACALGHYPSAIGTFEVALSFMAQRQRMSPFEIGLLFAQCTLFMFAVRSFPSGKISRQRLAAIMATAGRNNAFLRNRLAANFRGEPKAHESVRLHG